MHDEKLELELFKLLKEYRRITSMPIGGDTYDVLDKLSIFLTENSFKLYGRNDIYTSSDVFFILNTHRIKPIVDTLYAFNDDASYETIEKYMYDFRNELKRAMTNVFDIIDHKQVINKIIISDIVQEVKNIIRYHYNEAPNLTAYIRTTIFTDEDRKALSEDVTDLWVVSTIQAHYKFVMDLFDDSIVPNSMKDIANLAQFIYSCIGEGQTKSRISDLEYNKPNEESREENFSGGYIEGKPIILCKSTKDGNQAIHFKKDTNEKYKYYILKFNLVETYEDAANLKSPKVIVIPEDKFDKNILYVYSNIIYMIIEDQVYDIFEIDKEVVKYKLEISKATANYVSKKFMDESIQPYRDSSMETMNCIEFSNIEKDSDL